MARQLYQNNDESYRAIMVRTSPNGVVYTSIYGPYKTAGTAKGVATQKQSWLRRQGYTFEVTIERAQIVWKAVE